MDEDSVTLLPGFGIRDVDASEIHPLEVLISVTHGEVIIDQSFSMENVEIFVGDASSGGSVDGTLGFRDRAEDADAVLSWLYYVPTLNFNGEWGRLPSSRKPLALTSDLACFEISAKDSRLSDQLPSSTLSRESQGKD